MRLQKYLSHAGVASRRAAETLIARGHVRVNGRVVREMGVSVSEADRVDVDGRTIALTSQHVYVMLHKPAGVMTTMHDPQGRRTILDMMPPDLPRIVPVGRLDYDSSGLLLLTNDGDLAHRLTHPKYGVEKRYRALVRGRLVPEEVERLRGGVEVDGVRTAGAPVRVVATRRDTSVVDMTIHEGRNRQVRRMFEAVGHPVIVLERLRFGPLKLGDLPVGQARELTDHEVASLRTAVAPAVGTQ